MARRFCLAMLLLLALAHAPARAGEEAPPLRVATRLVPPFVFSENGRLTGFSVELWQSISEQLGLRSQYFVTPSVTDLLAAVRSGKADLGISAVSITAERDKTLDFSQPMFDSGLQILVRSEPTGPLGAVRVLLAGILSPAFLQLIGILLALILLPAHLVWLIERRRPDGIVDRAYLPGIFKACWWAAATLATQADEMPRSAGGRLVAVIWMFTSVVFVAYFTAAVTTSLTVRQLRGNIRGPEDLPGRHVATLAGSTSAAYLREQKSRVLTFTRIEAAYAALASGEADAVVFDAPVLLYYATREGKGKVAVVGEVFRKERYGIVFPPASPYRKPVNNALLALEENGTYERLYEKWFGNKE